MGYYDTAQICKNGHVITAYYEKYPDGRKAFCEKCGAAAITQCEGCRGTIRAKYHSDIPMSPGSYSTPSFCPSCGRPYPWTVLKMEAAKELIEEMEGLEVGERRLLGQSLDELATDSPKAEVAGLRFKRIMKKVSKESYAAMKTVVTNILSESIKKTLFGP
jgi:hypothetical protein